MKAVAALMSMPEISVGFSVIGFLDWCLHILQFHST